MKPIRLCKLIPDRALAAHENFAATWNWLVDFCANLAGDGDRDRAKKIRLDRSVDDRPVIKFAGDDGMPPDGKSIVAAQTSAGKRLAIFGFADAEADRVPKKNSDGELEWVEMSGQCYNAGAGIAIADDTEDPGAKKISAYPVKGDDVSTTDTQPDPSASNPQTTIKIKGFADGTPSSSSTLAALLTQGGTGGTILNRTSGGAMAYLGIGDKIKQGYAIKFTGTDGSTATVGADNDTHPGGLQTFDVSFASAADSNVQVKVAAASNGVTITIGTYWKD